MDFSEAGNILSPDWAAGWMVCESASGMTGTLALSAHLPLQWNTLPTRARLLRTRTLLQFSLHLLLALTWSPDNVQLSGLQPPYTSRPVSPKCSTVQTTPFCCQCWVLNSGKIAGATTYVSKSCNKFKGLDHQTDSEIKSYVTLSQVPRPLDVNLAQISLVPL